MIPSATILQIMHHTHMILNGLYLPLEEEEFLLKLHGDEYEYYKSRTNRFVPRIIITLKSEHKTFRTQ
jgi:protein-S-isoprenylcysteine O-methyltransferase Ste14